VKAMQAMFAYKQCKEANYNIAIEQLESSFRQDLNSMEIQDPIELEDGRKASIEMLKNAVGPDSSIKFASESDAANVAAKEAFKSYQDQIKKDYKKIKNQMILECERIYDRYIKILALLLRFSQFAGQGVGSKKSTSDDQVNFVNNLLINVLKSNKEFGAISLKKNLNWEDEMDLIRVWFKKIVVVDEVYEAYIKSSPSIDDDYDLLDYLVRKVIFKNEDILSYWENQDINWEEDQTVIRSLVIKTLKSLREKGEDFELSILSYNWEEDKAFFEKLFESTIKEEAMLQALVAEKTKNWEFERIAYTDRLILMLAISEMIHFPSIPVKVTINEFIEVSKNYSTPKSKQFVNGVLDVIAVDLQEKGRIKKSGRGLIDNK
jgi:N utilization substance protein B